MSLNRCDVKIDGEGTAANPSLANRLLLLIRPQHLHQCGHGRCYTAPEKACMSETDGVDLAVVIDVLFGSFLFVLGAVSSSLLSLFDVVIWGSIMAPAGGPVHKTLARPPTDRGAVGDHLPKT